MCRTLPTTAVELRRPSEITLIYRRSGHRRGRGAPTQCSITVADGQEVRLRDAYEPLLGVDPAPERRAVVGELDVGREAGGGRCAHVRGL